MDVVERYLEAVAAQLPAEEREDIIAELRDLILSRIEAKEETLARSLTDAEREAILKEIGHPLVVAARYRKGPDALIGPELFPYWLYGVKAGLLVLAVVSAIGLFARLIGGSANFGQDIAQTFHGFFGAGLTLIGALTVAGAVMEHYGIRPKWLTDWRAGDLSAFQLSDPGQWGAATGAAKSAVRAPRLSSRGKAVGETAFSSIALGLFILWWVGLLQFPGFGVMTINDTPTTVTPAPIWNVLFAPILIYALAQFGVDLFNLFQPQARRIRAVLSIGIAVAGLWLTWVIWQAGHWFTLSAGGEQVRIAGDLILLDVNRMRELGQHGRDLIGVSSTLSLILTWVLAISAGGLVWQMFANLWRLVQPGVVQNRDR